MKQFFKINTVKLTLDTVYVNQILFTLDELHE